MYLSPSFEDQLFPALRANLLSDDRGLLLGSLRAMCRLVVGRDEANRIGQVQQAAIDRIKSLIMLEDEDLVSACLDFLYQYTANEENVEKLMQQPYGIELIKQLMRLLLYQAIPGEQVVWLTRLQKPLARNTTIPTLPQEIVNDLLSFPEPERAAKW
jgi:chromatin structure-remodeling complex subunit RSC9